LGEDWDWGVYEVIYEVHVMSCLSERAIFAFNVFFF